MVLAPTGSATADRTKWSGTPLGPLVMFAAAFAGLLLVIFSGHTLFSNYNARRWPTTTGTVVTSCIVMVEVGNSRSTQMVPRAEVKFQYAVAGETYESDHLSYTGTGIGATRNAYPPGWQKDYPAGKTVRVAYNPAQPANAVVDLSHDPYLPFIGGVILLLIYGCYLFRFHRDRANRAIEPVDSRSDR